MSDENVQGPDPDETPEKVNEETADFAEQPDPTDEAPVDPADVEETPDDDEDTDDAPAEGDGEEQ